MEINAWAVILVIESLLAIALGFFNMGRPTSNYMKINTNQEGVGKVVFNIVFLVVLYGALGGWAQ